MAKIERISEEELGRVRALALVIWPAHYIPLIGKELVTDIVADIYSVAALQADIRNRNHTYWLATVDGNDVGYSSAYVADGRIWLKKLYLLPEVRGMGLGKRLIETASDFFFGRDHPQALYVAEKNLTAIEFYRSQGFEIEALEPVNMGPHRFHDYIMSRPASSHGLI